MGGSGSGSHGGKRRKQLVEACCHLLVLPGGKVQATTWGGSWEMRQESHGDAIFLVVRGTLNGWKTDQSIEVVTWKPRFGGVATWVLCPRCGRKCRKLYMPHGAAEYRCHRCWNLAYWTSQNAHFYDRGFFGFLTSIYAEKSGISMKQLAQDQMRERKVEIFGELR